MPGKDTTNLKLTNQIGNTLFDLFVSNVDECAIFMTDPDGYILTWNEGAKRLKGYTQKEILEKNISIFYPSEDVLKNKPQNHLKKALMNGKHESEGWQIKKDGVRFWANVIFTPIYDDDKKLLGFAKFTRAINQKDKSDQLSIANVNTAKSKHEKKAIPQLNFQKLIENSHDGIALMDSKFKVFYRSHSTERISGWSEEERRERDFIALIHPDDIPVIEKTLQEILLKPGSSVLATIRAMHKQGHYIWAETIYTNMLYDADVNAIVCNYRDVSERKNAENLLRKRTEQIDLFLDRITDGFISLDSNFCYIYVNKKFCESVGLPAELLIGKCVWDVFPQSVGSETYKAFHKAFNEQKFVRSEDYYAPLSLWYEDTIYPSEAGLSVFIKDISEQKKAEQQVLEKQEELKKAQQMQSAILNALPPLIALLNEEGKIIAVNDSWRKFILENKLDITDDGVGYSYLAICEKAIGFDSVYIDKAARGIKNVLLGEAKEFGLEHYEDLTGKRHWFKLLVAPLQDKSSKNAIVMHIDITDQKTAEQSLIKSEANLRSIFENTDLSIVLLDTKLKIASFNTNAQNLAIKHFGKKLKVGSEGPAFLPEERRALIEESIGRVIKNNEIVTYEAFYSMKDGSTEWFDVKWIGVVGEKGDNVGVVLTFKNITAKKQYEKERSKITADLVQRNKDLEEYAYIVSHNLRAPVANIMGLSNILSAAEPDIDDIKGPLHALSVSANNLDKVVIDLNQILQVTRRANDKFEWVSFASVIEDIREDICGIIPPNRVTIKNNFSGIDKLWSQKSFLHNIFLNLITNGIKYRREGHDPVITIRSVRTKNIVTLTFEDNGKGIDLEKHGHQIFGLYKRFDRHTEGKGMGLFMVKTQVESLGGRISVQSTPGKGTKFTIEMPVLDTDLIS
jgi:PAS domain S-box-containing protein